MLDIVLPDGNEKELILMAQRLGYRELLFLYFPGVYSSIQLPESKIKSNKGMLLDAKDLLRNSQKYKKHFVAIKSSEKDREILETKACSLLFDLELQPRKDFIHQRASGFNHVLAQLAHDNKTTIGFSFLSLLEADNREILMGRMSQNLLLCEKYGVLTALASFAHSPIEMRSHHDLRSLSGLLG